MGRQKSRGNRQKAKAGWLTIAVMLVAVYSGQPAAGPLLPGAFRQPPADSWREAEAGYRYEFPRDHAAHEDYGIEWWYYTGNLQAKGGRWFGYQLTFFRVGVARQPANPSRWAVRDLYMAHFAISDIEQKQFHFFDRINRAGIGWAGAATEQYHIWNEDWSAHLDGRDHVLRASVGTDQIDLRLAATKPEAIHGTNGISQKGPSAGSASYYYSLTRMETAGRLTVGGEPFAVTGLSWMDHEFGTSFLKEMETGWDWFSVQLDDGRELMLLEIRRSDGQIDPRSSGTLIDSDGRATHVPFGEFALASSEVWRSPDSGAAYPTAWTIDLPRYGLRLSARAAFAEQELRTTESTGVTYWEGSMKVEGTADGKAVSGRGYLEMTGYAGQGLGAIFRSDK